MFNLYEMISGAHGGQGLDNLAQQFGLSRTQADSAVKALLPSLSTAFMTKAQQPGGVNELAGAMTDDGHKQAYQDPIAAQDPATQQNGGNVLGGIFGSNAIIGNVVQSASQYTGIPAATIEQMLPVIASMIIGGVATQMNERGMGGILGQLASGGLGGALGGAFGGGAGGGLGGILGSILGGGNQAGTQASGTGQAGTGQAGTGQAGAADGGFGGMLGNIFGSLLGGGQPEAQQPAGQGAGQGGGSAVQEGMNAFSKMFNPGVTPSPAQPDDLGEQIGSILGDKRN